MSDAIKCVLVATGGSAGALRADAVAIGIASGCRSRLIIVTDSRGLPGDEVRRLAQAEGDTSKARHALINQIFEAAKRRAAGASVADICPVSDHGDPAFPTMVTRPTPS